MALKSSKTLEIIYKPKSVAKEISELQFEPICTLIFLAILVNSVLQQAVISIKYGGYQLDITFIIQVAISILATLVLILIAIKAITFFIKKQITSLKLVNIILLTQTPRLLFSFVVVALYLLFPSLVELQSFNKGMNFLMLIVTAYSYLLIGICVLSTLKNKQNITKHSSGHANIARH
jgi:hypothetical protein